MEITTIKLQKSTKNRLDRLRLYRRETYDEVLQKMLGILNLCKANPEGARRKLRALDRGRRRVMKKRGLGGDGQTAAVSPHRRIK